MLRWHFCEEEVGWYVLPIYKFRVGDDRTTTADSAGIISS
jgi:hypothetical protein